MTAPDVLAGTLRIAWSRPDGGMDVYQPSPRHFARLCGPGGLIAAPRVEVQIDRFHRLQGMPIDNAARYVRAACAGGLSPREALSVMRGKDCWSGHGHVVLHAGELPDRWFRNAWRLHGRRILIDLEAARVQQAERILYWRAEYLALARHIDARSRLIGRRSNAAAMGIAMAETLDLDLVGRAIASAPDADSLRRIWPATDFPALEAIP